MGLLVGNFLMRFKKMSRVKMGYQADWALIAFFLLSNAILLAIYFVGNSMIKNAEYTTSVCAYIDEDE